MAKSLLLKSPNNFAGNSRPPLTRDPMIRPGGKFMFDFTDPRCHPGGVITPGAVAAGTAFQSLDNTPVSAVVVGTGVSVNADGSLQFTGVNGSYLQVGTAGQFNAAAAPYEAAYGVHMKLPASGYSTTNYWAILKNGGNANDSQFYIDAGIGGVAPRAAVGTGSSSVGSNPAPAAMTPGTIYQHAVRYDPGAIIADYRNGAQAASNSASIPSALQDKPTSYMQIGGGVGVWTCYRAFLTDIDGSLAQETTWGFADADKLTAAQQILRDYQFCTNALTAAPKTPFA